MEDLNESFSVHKFSEILNETFPKEVLEVDARAENEEKIIENLISQLSDAVPEQSINQTFSSLDHEQTTQETNITLRDPPNVEEILETEERLITPSSHNVTVINAACQQVLKQMEYQLVTLLKKNRKEQDVIQEFLNANFKCSYFENPKKYSAKCVGMPYFKDLHGFQPPPNEDVLRKKKNNKLLPVDFIKSFSIWNRADAKNLVNAIKQYDTSDPSTIDWMKISVTDMEGKYSPSECKSKWTLHLNPIINKSRWNSKEIELLKVLSAKYNYQDWDNIAKELKTNRTGLQCCIQYQTHTFPTEGKWTKEEDETLQYLVDKYKFKDYIPWAKVSWHFEHRSSKQCQERYVYHLGNIKKGYFTMEEDFVIVYLASKLKNFGEVAKFLPKRVATQVRSRYEYLVQLSMPAFSKEEDKLLTKLMVQYPRNWGKISENFKNRSRVQCRKRWAYLQKKILLEDDPCSENENDESLSSTSENKRAKSEKDKIDAENVKKNIHLISKPAQRTRKYSEKYQHLLDYHKYCHKFLFGPKPRIPDNTDNLKKLVVKLRITMKNLSVPVAPSSKFNINALSDNCTFDKEDLAVLNELVTDEQTDHEFKLSKKIIPPNYMSLVALRSFTLGWDKIKNLCHLYKNVPQPPSQINSNDRILCTDAKRLFKSRLKAIFAFPLIFSNISSEDKQKPGRRPKVRKTVKPLSKRKRKEHAKFMNASYRNKLKAIFDQFDASGSHPFGEAEEFFKPKSPKTYKSQSKSVQNTATREKNCKAGENSNANFNQISIKRTHSFEIQNEQIEKAPLKKQRMDKNA